MNKVLFLFLLLAGSLSAAILNVPDDFRTIQAAINAAEEGDTVLVAPGEYVENLNLASRRITLASSFIIEGDTAIVEETVIDGNAQGAVLSFSNNARGTVVGLTIQNGLGARVDIDDRNWYYTGGGIVATDATLVFTCCIIRENVVRGLGDNGEAPKGGGLYLSGGSATMHNCLVTENEPEGFYGNNTQTELIRCRFENNIGSGAITSGRATVVDECSFTNNSSQGLKCENGYNLQNSEFRGNAGSGLVVWGRGLVFNCQFIENVNSGMNVSQSTAVIENCLFEENTAQFGGGFMSQGSDLDTLIGCTFRNNLATITGGAIRSAHRTSIKLFNCVFEDNLADNGQGVGYGGAIYGRDDANIDIVNCTLYGNRAGTGGALAAGTGFHPLIKNSILYNNGDHPIDFTGGGGNIFVRYSLVEGGQGGIIDPNGAINWLDGNIDEDPLFVDPENGDFHLTEDSPCIDAGDPNSHEDPDGTRADMGAFYFDQNLPPQIVRGIDEVIVEEDCGFFAIASLDTIFSDPNGDDLSFFFSGDERLGLSIDEAGLLSVEPALNFNADSLQASVFAFDAADTVSLVFFVTITPVNDPPSAFVLLRPEDDFQFGYQDTVDFTWEASVDPDGDSEVRYLLHLEGSNFDSSWIVDTGNHNSARIPDAQFEVIWPNGGCSTLIYTWWVQAVSGDDTVASDNRFSLEIYGSGAVHEPSHVTRQFSLSPAFPNPFNSTTTISYSLPAAGRVSLAVYDLSGRLVERLVEGMRDAGRHSVTLDGQNLAAGVYFAELRGEVIELRTKVALVK